MIPTRPLVSVVLMALAGASLRLAACNVVGDPPGSSEPAPGTDEGCVVSVDAGDAGDDPPDGCSPTPIQSPIQ